MKYFALFVIIHFSIAAQSQNNYEFELLVNVPATGLNDQQSSGTCWSFATCSFLEAEALRIGKDSVRISPMFYVTPSYLAKAEKYISTAGESYFSPGDLTFSVMDAYEKYGAVPESVYNGIIPGDWKHDQLEMDNLLLAMVESIGTSGYGRIKPNSWKLSIEAVLAAYIGKAPATFVYKNKLHSPQSFANEYVGIDPQDYIEITSFSHLPFYEMVELNIPANWNNKKYYNVPIEDFESILDHALENGFSLAWDGDATEPLFDFETGILELTKMEEESIIEQKFRQEQFENKSTTDDHNMHIIGKAKNADDKIYYILKNSEGTNGMDGYIYMTKNALLLKTISLLVHKDAIPKHIKK